jgi:hypothetical protein
LKRFAQKELGEARPFYARDRKWHDAGFLVQDAEAAAKKARDHYKNASRKKNYRF